MSRTSRDTLEIEDTAALVERFKATFPRGRGDLYMARAPGRVNLIGEHTDYNDGYVLPVAVDREVRVVGQRRPDDRVVLYSANFDYRSSFELDAIGLASHQTWINYPQGVAYALQRRGYRLPGMNIVMSGNVPLGAGMSSSAAVEIACILLFKALGDLSEDPIEDIRLAQTVENEFIGIQSGIMDQCISRLGVPGHALLLDCRSLVYEPIAIALSHMILGVVHSGVPRGLARSAYNTRREECVEGVRLLHQWLPTVTALRDVTLPDLALYEDRLPETIRRRCRHVVSENGRVGEAAYALRAGDITGLGRLFAASQDSMRDDYQVSVPAVDLLVKIAREEGAVASRMTGGGFGGCTVNLVPSDRWEDFSQGVDERYRRDTRYEPTIFKCHSMGGATIERLDV